MFIFHDGENNKHFVFGTENNLRDFVSEFYENDEQFINLYETGIINIFWGVTSARSDELNRVEIIRPTKTYHIIV